jgi:hypothetical protein
MKDLQDPGEAITLFRGGPSSFSNAIISLFEPILAFSGPDPQHKRKLAKISQIWTSKGLNFDFRELYVPWQIVQFFKGKLFTLQTLLCLIIKVEGPDAGCAIVHPQQ